MAVNIIRKEISHTVANESTEQQSLPTSTQRNCGDANLIYSYQRETSQKAEQSNNNEGADKGFVPMEEMLPREEREPGVTIW